MAGVGNEHWTERPKIRLERELGQERFIIQQGFRDSLVQKGYGTDSRIYKRKSFNQFSRDIFRTRSRKESLKRS